MSEVTRILAAIDRGEPHAAAELLPLVYDELRQLAAARMAAERAGHTLDATALVHEAYLRLVGPADGDGARFGGRAHFFGAAAEAMRRILIDRARARQSRKRGGDRRRVELDAAAPLAAPADHDDDLLALDQALRAFEAEDPAKAQLVKLRYFAGLSIQQAADALGISPATAKRHWVYARSWLYGRIHGE